MMATVSRVSQPFLTQLSHSRAPRGSAGHGLVVVVDSARGAGEHGLADRSGLSSAIIYRASNCCTTFCIVISTKVKHDFMRMRSLIKTHGTMYTGKLFLSLSE